MPKDQGPVRQTQVIMFIDNTNIDDQKKLKHVIFNSPTWEY